MSFDCSNEIGNSGVFIPSIVFGTSYLGNLYKKLSYDEKLRLVQGWFMCTEKPVIDSAGKYGAGMSLEMIGRLLGDLNVDPGQVTISNKLGWYRIPLRTEEPTFEPGVWVDCNYDAVQKISYEGIIQCWEQGEELLGGKYKTQLVSVHDPDEYLTGADSLKDREKRLLDITEAYRALFELKAKGLVKAVGVGSKDWHVIEELYGEVKFDWVMLANSFTIMKHTDEFLGFVNRLHRDGVAVINSAIFHGGFVTGSDFFDYKKVDPESSQGKEILAWRNGFDNLCSIYKVHASDAAIHFVLSHPAVSSLALNTSKQETMLRNWDVLHREIPKEFWREMKLKGLISANYNYI
ncbi:aldo/keto reductase [Plebeiibacterium marinum]|uniref:Aldo/keto reductase n=1 Tax=Plebeiibacterium marinum TaxID=2992111 RepID=A0AAE3SKT2_9BACT|nr:aldo/keto reductase [Plebeiobacterium marinum]MCW3805855.1 aldo/keto reductase [Plebeiobacterium marinum]